MNYPKLRNVSAFPVELSDGQYIVLQDPHHYAEQPVMISPGAFFILQFFDGKHSRREIQDAYMRQFDTTLDAEALGDFITHLDQCLFLDSPTFSSHVRQIREAFACMTVRPSSHQGAAYPEDKEVLMAQLDTYFNHPDDSQPVPESYASSHPVKAILAPHIDINSGGLTFARAYQALMTSDAELFIILGTSHVDMQNFFALTAKAFETPLGRVETDQEVVQALTDRLPYNPFDDELIHKSEYSVEFQVLFLQYLHARALRPAAVRHKPLRIVPLLCGGQMYEAIYDGQSLEHTPQLEASIQALAEVLQRLPKACLIAGVDFSHIGLRYDDQDAPSPEVLHAVEHVDRGLLEALEQVNPTQFVARLQACRNATRVCGFAPMYAMLRLLEGTRGKLLHYDRAETGPGSVVTFAGMAWQECENQKS